MTLERLRAHLIRQMQDADAAGNLSRGGAFYDVLKFLEGETVVVDVAGLAFTSLRDANAERQSVWCPTETPDLSFRGVELAGEVGEVCNVVKKLERERLGWRGSRDTVAHLGDELADVVICADLLALSAGIDLGLAVVAKFDDTSRKVGIPVYLGDSVGRPLPATARAEESLAHFARRFEARAE